jgi:hypothetical protein
MVEEDRQLLFSTIHSRCFSVNTNSELDALFRRLLAKSCSYESFVTLMIPTSKLLFLCLLIGFING